jgi:hypothetical protein
MRFSSNFGHFALHLLSTATAKCMERIGIEPMTSWLQTRRSPS